MKSEIRNSKSETSTKLEMRKEQTADLRRFRVLFAPFFYFRIEFVSDFEIRISDFPFRIRTCFGFRDSDFGFVPGYNLETRPCAQPSMSQTCAQTPLLRFFCAFRNKWRESDAAWPSPESPLALPSVELAP